MWILIIIMFNKSVAVEMNSQESCLKARKNAIEQTAADSRSFCLNNATGEIKQ